MESKALLVYNLFLSANLGRIAGLTKIGEYDLLNGEIDICFLAYERVISFGADPERPPGPQFKEGEII
jgi:hypothetical protein